MRKQSKNSKTLLGSIETMSDSERKEFDERNIREWKDKRLIEIIKTAQVDKNFAIELCEEVTRLAYGKKELAKILKSAIAGSGRYPPTPPFWNDFCLWHYAGVMGTSDIEDYKKREKAVIDYLILCKAGFTGKEVSHATMQNNVTKAIASSDISELPKWMQKVINKRVARGERWGKN